MAYSTLKVAKNKLKDDLYKAFYDAYMIQCDTSKVEDVNISNFIKTQFQQTGKNFAKEISDKMSQAIYDFVMEMKIEVPAIPPTVMVAGVPCTGNIPFTCFKIS